MNEKNLKDVLSYIISSQALDGSINDLAFLIAKNGTNTTRKNCLEMINQSDFKTLKSFKTNSLKLIIAFAKVSLKDNIVSEDEIKSIRFLKLLLDINEGDFMKDKTLAKEVSIIITNQVDLMFSDDQKIDNDESIQKVNLQEIFGLSYDEFAKLTNEAAIAAWDRGSDILDLDTYFDGNDYQKWWDKNNIDTELQKEAEGSDDDTEDSENDRSRKISQIVKDRVWNRDNGICVKCGTNENLEFDHIIPFSKGGANTYRNVQLLCESCNRSKSDSIG